MAWYHNPHDAESRHTKDLDIEVLVGAEAGDGEETLSARVQMRRFAMEVDTIAAFIERSGDADPKPACLYDGSLVVSFASSQNARIRHEYVSAISHLLDVSESTHVPLVGYVASSAARDVVDMLSAAGLLDPGGGAQDVSLLSASLPDWGDRSVAYLCARDDKVLSTYPGHSQAPPDYRIAFCYLRWPAPARPGSSSLPGWHAMRPNCSESWTSSAPSA